MILIIVPTYNEAANVEELCSKIFIHAPDASILFVDDNSQDGTRDVIKSLQSIHGENKISILCRPNKMGLGTAYIAGFSWGLAKGYEIFIEMDADLSHEPHYLKEMIKLAQEHKVVIGSRYCHGGGIQKWGIGRRLLSRGGSAYSRLILNLTISDLTGGFNLWHRDVLTTIPFNAIKSNGYAFQVELKYLASLYGFSVKEFPIIFSDRRAGSSKMSLKIIFEAIFRILSLKWNYRNFTR